MYKEIRKQQLVAEMGRQTNLIEIPDRFALPETFKKINERDFSLISYSFTENMRQKYVYLSLGKEVYDEEQGYLADHLGGGTATSYHIRAEYDYSPREEKIQYRKQAVDNLVNDNFYQYKFIDCKENTREKIDKSIIELASAGEWWRAQYILQSIGEETNEKYIEDLEEKYQVNLESLRMAVEMYKLTYALWDANIDFFQSRDSYPEEERAKKRTEIQEKLQDIKKSAEKLSNYIVHATHIPRTINSQQGILQNKEIQKSIGDQFEGEGIYTGLMHEYAMPYYHREDGVEVINFKIALKDTFPIITSYDFPQAMANILCDRIDIKDNTAVPKGDIQWRQNEFDKEPIEKWQIELLKQYLETEDVNLKRDENGVQYIEAKTDKAPIIWSSACRALKINHFVPKEY